MGLGVQKLSVSRGTVYAAGYFHVIGGKHRDELAAIDADTGEVTSWNPKPKYSSGNPAPVYALDASGGKVYAGGEFETIGGRSRAGIAALDGQTGKATSFNPNPGGSGWSVVYAIAVSGSTVYVSGSFTSIGRQPRFDLAAVDTDTGKATDFDPHPYGSEIGDGEVEALAVSGSTVYAGGFFDGMAGQPRPGIAALDATTGAPTSWNPEITRGVYGGAVLDVAVTGQTVYVGGDYNEIGGQDWGKLAALNANTGGLLPWNPRPNCNVDTLDLASDGSLWVGGCFTGFATATSPQAYVAKFSP
jgi:hypothetical protein